MTMNLNLNLLVVTIVISIGAFTQETRQLAIDKPQSIADLRTIEGASLVNAHWYVQAAHITEKEFYLPGPQKGGGDALPLYATGRPIQSNSLHPQIGADDFENGFLPINSTEVESRQGTGCSLLFGIK